jgi:Holliday junction resolvasome RuvABC endonuclease subunit
MRVLGLDISTSCTGVAVLDEEFNIIALTHIDFKKCNDFWEKVDRARVELYAIIEQYNPDEFCVEQILQSFTPGFSSAGTIMLLAQFNAILSASVRDKMGKSPTFITSGHARKLCGLKMLTKAKSGGRTHKEQVQDYLVEGYLKHIDFPKTKTGKLKPFVGDECDAYVMARAGVTILKK